jgi:hypothetical protein
MQAIEQESENFEGQTPMKLESSTAKACLKFEKL